MATCKDCIHQNVCKWGVVPADAKDCTDFKDKSRYRKQSEDMVSIETVKKWLYEIAINNVGCVIDGDFSNACEEIISRLDGLKRFAEEKKGGE